MKTQKSHVIAGLVKRRLTKFLEEFFREMAEGKNWPLSKRENCMKFDPKRQKSHDFVDPKISKEKHKFQ